MRIVIAVAVVALGVGCRERGPKPPAVAEAEPWARIEALARPRLEPKDHEDLSRALEMAARNRDAWRDLRYKVPPTPLAGYPEGAQAVAALVRWLGADGGLPPAAPPPGAGPSAMQLFDVGRLAIDTATDGEWSGVAAGAHLGHRMVSQGGNLLEATIGVSLLQDARRKARELGDHEAGWELPSSGELVRIAAAEAMYWRRSSTYLRTPEGRRATEAEIAKLAPETRRAAAQVAGAQLAVPSDAEMDATNAFWLAALDGAKAGEPAAATIARLRKAHAALRDDKLASSLGLAVGLLERLAADLDALSSS